MDFRKWNSIENHYQERIIQKWTEYYPELNNMFFEVTEKIHGANFSILVNTDGSVRYASRNGIIEDNDKFYGFKEIFSRPEYVEMVSSLKNISKSWKSDLQLFGELYGGKIQKGVFYGAEKNFKWYALRIKDDIVRPIISDNLLRNIIAFKVPVIKIVKSKGYIYDLIDTIDHEFQSKLTPEDYEEDNVCEGVVIVPYDIMIRNGDSYFMIKKKGEKFKDKKAKPKVIKAIESDVQNLIDEAISYINENRTNDLQSKIGAFEEMKDISKFAKEYFKDLFADFEKDNYTEWNDLDKISQGIVKKTIGTKIYQELKLSLLR